ncbi:MAG: SURF1 family protein [Dokdonella sp.]
MSAHWRRPSVFAIALLIVGVVASVWMGFWQLRRADEKQRLFDAFSLAGSAAPISLTKARRDETPQHYPRVSVSGRYDGRHVYLLDNQTRGGRAGVVVWMLFQPDEGGPTILVDRGFLVQDDPYSKPAIPALPSETATLTGLYAPPPGFGLRLGGDTLPGQAIWPKSTIRIDRGEIARDSSRTLDTRVLLLDAEPAGGFERHWTPEVMVPDKHRAYALQWFSFAIAALVIFVVLHRRRESKDSKK